MRRAILTLLAVMAASACDPGPLPEPKKPSADKRGWFPSKSDDLWPLDVAIRSNNLDEVRLLLNRGADPNARWGQTGDHFPLQEIFDTGHGSPVPHRDELVRLLLEHGADPNMRWCPFESRGNEPGWASCVSDQGTFALAWAASGGLTEVVEMLLAAGADPTMQDWSGSSALDYALDDPTFELIARAQFPDLGTRDRAALAWLSGNRHPAYGEQGPQNATAILRLLSPSVGVIYPPARPERAFSTYSRDWNSEAATESKILLRLRTLLRIGANPNERTGWPGYDWTALGVALAAKHYRAARLLLDHGADVNQRWCEDITSDYFRDETPIDPRCGPQTGLTTLMWAAADGDEDGVRLLLEYGADVSLRNWAGLSAADLARADSIRRLLEDRSSIAIPPPSR